MQTISVAELRARMEAGEKLNLVDVREPHENEEFNIGGRLVPLGQIQNMQIDELEGQACLLLETMGFTNIVNVTGGMLAWEESFGKNAI
jgi:rhodanese-related sulfurtransferase